MIYTVSKKVDAVVVYDTEVEAESPEAAAKLAYDNPENYKWSEGDPIEYDAHYVVTLDDDLNPIESTRQGESCL